MHAKCTRCKETKPLSEFPRSGRRCKGCERERLQAWRKANPAKRAAQNRRARPTPEQRRTHYQENREDYTRRHQAWYARYREREIQKSVARSRQWRSDNPEEQRLLGRAWAAVAAAIARGILMRPDACEECGKSCKPDAAHFNYREPLRVRWLCRSCHSFWDVAEPKLSA